MKIDKYGHVAMNAQEFEEMNRFFKENPQYNRLPWNDAVKMYIKYLEHAKPTQ